MTVQMGVDVGGGRDKSVAVVRRDNVVLPPVRWSYGDTMRTVGEIITLIRRHEPDRVVMDVAGIGVGPFNRLREQEYHVIGFNGARRATGRDRSGELEMGNARAQAWWNLRELLDPEAGAEIELPDDPLLIGDLTAPHWRTSSAGKVYVEDKDEIRARLNRSPDTGDALAMAFWTPVKEDWFISELARMASCPRCHRDGFVQADDGLWRCTDCHFVAESDGVTPARGNRLF